MKNYLLLLMLFGLFRLSAQHPYFYNIGTEQDLPSSEVYKVKQDSFGFIWIGCDAGLFRYDGFRFKQYRNEKMAGRSISDLKFDSEGIIWCRNFNGQLLKVSGDSLRIMLDYSKNKGSSFNFTFSNDGNLWLAEKHKVLVYDGEMNLKKEINLEQSAQSKVNDIMDIACHDAFVYIFRNQSGIYKIDISKFVPEKIKGQPETDFSKNYGAFSFFSFDALYFMTERYDGANRLYNIYRVNNESVDFVKSFVSGKESHFLYNIRSFEAEKLWICSSSGLFELGKAEGDSLISKNALLKGQRVSDMLRDREGNYWFSTLQNGIFVIPSLDVISYTPENNSGLKVPYLTKLHRAKDQRIWIGSHSGKVFNFNPSDHSVTAHFDELFPPYRAVKSFFETESELFISRNSNFAVGKNKAAKRVSVSDARAVWIIGDSVFSVSPSRFVKSYLIRQKNQIIEFDSTVVLAANGGWAMAYDSSMQALWVTLSSGVHYYQHSTLQALSDKGQPIYAGYLDYERGIMWVSTMNNGLYGFEKGKIKYHFTEKNGLRNNSTKVVDAHGDYVFVSAGNFLHRIYLPDQSVEVLSKNLGIFGKDVEDIEILDDKVYLATHKGLICFPLNIETQNRVRPNIIIESVSLSGEAIDAKELLNLPYRHAQLRISFLSAAFRSKGDFYYEYRLVGLDSSWTRLNSENNFVGFSAIPPGKYRFEVRAINESGISGEIRSLELKVLTPIWQQWWFYLLLSLGFIALVFWFYNIRVRTLTKRMQMEQELSTSQLTALKAQMNPHFMYNALNSIQDLMLTNDVRNANLYLNKFSTLMRRILKASDSEEILLDEEISILKLYLDLEKLRFGDEFEYSIETDEKLKLEHISIPSMIIQPFVENAVKHGLLHKKGQKKITIEFIADKAGLLICNISDNGIGRKRAGEIKERALKQHQSFATKATEKRLEILNNRFGSNKIGLEIQDLYDEEGQALGTKVLLHIPFTKIDHS